MYRLLVIDDEEQMRKALYEVLKRKGYEVEAVERGEDGIAMLLKGDFSAVITDVKMPGMNGLEVLRSVRQVSPGTPVVMMTAFGTVENAIEAMKEGAEDYILKPFSADSIDSIIKRVLPQGKDRHTSNIVSCSGKMREILDVAKRIAPTLATVLITGESGTGKEVLSRFIHYSSDRRDGPFVAVNCASIPDGLLESELFGHEKGAFTGAVTAKKGKFEIANGGTILLDEVGEMGLQLQAKLLRVLQEREIDRVGGRKPVPVNIRVIATTNRDLHNEVEEHRFREDLFYRLNVFPITIPSLRERIEDIPALAEHFLRICCVRNGIDIKRIRADAMDCLVAYKWRGNVRELENVIERAVITCRDEEIASSDLFYGEVLLEPLQGQEDIASSGGTLRDMEKEMIFKTLDGTVGNKTKAAKLLGISIRTLRNKLKEYTVEERIA